MRHLLLISLLLLGLHLYSFAQSAKQYSFTHFTTSNGLSSNIVNSIAQDDKGFLWFATINGLQRYDGYKFLTFRSVKENEKSLPQDNLATLYYDKKENLWIATATNDIGIFDTRTFTFKRIPVDAPEKSFYNQLKIFETHDGKIVMQEFFGDTYRYDEKKGKMVIDNDFFPLPKGWRKSSIAWDANINRYWIGADSGLAMFNPATRHLSYRGHNAENNEVIDAFQNDKVILGLFVDTKKNVSIYSWPPATSHPYLLNYNYPKKEALKFNLSDKIGVDYHELTGFLQQKSGRVWIFGRPVFAEWLPDKKTFIPIANEYKNEQSIKFEQVRTFFEDGENNIWIATDNGLFLFNPDAQIFNTYNLMRWQEKATYEAPVQAVRQTKEGNIFVGCWGKGLFNYDQDFNPIPLPESLQPSREKLSIWDIYQHSKTSKVWMELQHGGLLVYDPKTGAAEKVFPTIFENRTIRQATEDRQGNLWFGTQGGKIIKWDYQQSGGNIKTGYNLIYQTGLIHKLKTDSRGFIWAATLGSGLIKIDPKTNSVVKTYTSKSAQGYTLISNVPTDILQYNDTTLVVASGGLNIINLNTGKVTHITTAEGLPSNTAFCTQKDTRGNLWVGMTNGLCRINLENKIYTLFDRRSGIVYDNFNAAGAHRLKDGRLFYATDRNFLVFQPDSLIRKNETPRDPDFTLFKLSNKPLSLDSLLKAGKVELTHNNNSISIEFSVLSFLKQKQPLYYYMMEGLDKDWIRSEDINMAVYNHLPPGSYTFKVKAVNQDGNSSKTPVTLAIEVNPPFWRTWWFYGLIILLSIGILYLIDKERIKRLRALQRVRTQIAADLHDEINLTLNDINLLSEIAKIKADKDLDRSKDYIDQISVKSRSMIESMDDMLWSIDPQNDNMQKMLLRLKEYTDGFNKTHDVGIELTVDENVYSIVLDMKMRHEFLLFYKEALHFIVQHPVCSTIFIGLEYQKSKLNLKILAQCDQAKQGPLKCIEEEEMYKRAEELNAMLDIISDKKSISILLQTTV